MNMHIYCSSFSLFVDPVDLPTYLWGKGCHILYADSSTASIQGMGDSCDKNQKLIIFITPCFRQTPRAHNIWTGSALQNSNRNKWINKTDIRSSVTFCWHFIVTGFSCVVSVSLELGCACPPSIILTVRHPQNSLYRIVDYRLGFVVLCYDHT